VDAVRALAARGAGAGGAGGAAAAGPGAPAGEAEPRITIEWWFGLAPERLEGEGRVETAVFRSGEGETRIAVDDVITAIGFAADDGSPLEPGAHPDGRVEPGLYAAGWLRRGPRGTIPDQRADARDLARIIAADL